MEITSVNNKLVKELAKLNESKYRKLTNTFIVEGKHLVTEARNNNLIIDAYSIEEKEGYIKVSEEVMKKICNTDTVVTEIAVCKMLEKKELSNKILILDSIQDPGNLGTLLRTAKAFNFNTIVLGLNTVDLYNPKVIRSSQGAIFKLNIFRENLLEFIPTLSNYKVYGTNVRNGIDINDLPKTDKIAIVLGNEGNGISKEVDSLLKENIYISMDNTESLNVSIAGAIIMYELNK